MTNEEHDRLLIERVKKADHSAFRSLIEKYKDQAFTLALTILKDQGLAEDVLQEVLLKVYHRISSFKYQSTFYTWLYRIVVNQCYNEVRKHKNRNLDLENVQVGEDSMSKRSDDLDRSKVIQVALTSMKPDEALVLRLFYLSELKMQEVQEVTGFSLSKVKVTLHRARKNLAAEIQKKFGKEIEDL